MGFRSRFSVFKVFSSVFVDAAQSRLAYAAVDAVHGAHLGGIDELFARLGHELSLPIPGLRGDQAGPRVGSDLSDGWVAARSIAYASMTRASL